LAAFDFDFDPEPESTDWVQALTSTAPGVDPAFVRDRLLSDVFERGGVMTRAEALSHYLRHVVDDAVRSGALQVAYPGVYCLPGSLEDVGIRRRAALAYCPGGALSHLDALDEWGLPTAADPRVHITVPATRGVGASAALVLHRRRGFRQEPPSVVVRNEMPLVRIEQAIVESWPLLPALDRRAPGIVAVRERRTTPQRLLGILDSQRYVGASEQRKLFAQLAAGNHSELEIWGHAQVFSDRRLPASVAQYRIQVGGRIMYLDRAFVAEMVAVELDGAAYHGTRGQRERDTRRDALAAQVGWLTVRYTNRRLHEDVRGVVTELVAILRRRRSQLAS
jgi:very-short-patch-repair endonuclease